MQELAEGLGNVEEPLFEFRQRRWFHIRLHRIIYAQLYLLYFSRRLQY